jgi:hypothetical protein
MSGRLLERVDVRVADEARGDHGVRSDERVVVRLDPRLSERGVPAREALERRTAVLDLHRDLLAGRERQLELVSHGASLLPGARP